jgi:hypothetical protein
MHNVAYVSNEAMNVEYLNPTVHEIYVHKCPTYMSKVQEILHAYLYMLNILNSYRVY